MDDKEVFIGSFNFDPRSANINTELGVIIEDPELAVVFATLIEEALQTQTPYYPATARVTNAFAEVVMAVEVNEKGKVRWRGYENGEEVIYDKEPQTTWGQRFMAGFARILPKSQL